MRSFALAAVLLVSPLVVSSPVVSPLVGRAVAAQPAYSCGTGDQSLAINGLLSNGGTVNIAAGTCLLSHGLVLTVSGTVLNGAGMGQTILLATAPLTIDMVTMGLAQVPYRATGMTVSNLTVDGALHGSAGSASKIGRGVLVLGGVTQSFVTDVEARFGVNGLFLSGSSITASGVYLHDNRHAGMYVSGNGNLAAPYDFADSDTIVGSRIDNNALDNGNTSQWDGIDYDRQSSNGTIGGSTAALGNEVTGNDILVSCSGCAASAAIGPFLVENNTVTNSSESGIRLYDVVHDATVESNTLTGNQRTGINVVGHVQRATVANNSLSGQDAAGVDVFKQKGQKPGDSITVSGNQIVMGDLNKPAVQVIAATNVQVLDNALNGAPLSTAKAGAGLVVSGNH